MLVLDDYHAMANPAIDEVLVFLSDNALRTLHLLVAHLLVAHLRRSVVRSGALAGALSLADPSPRNSTKVEDTRSLRWYTFSMDMGRRLSAFCFSDDL